MQSCTTLHLQAHSVNAFYLVRRINHPWNTPPPPLLSCPSGHCRNTTKHHTFGNTTGQRTKARKDFEYMKYPVRGPSPIAVHGPMYIAVHSAIFSHLFWTVYFTTQWSTITGPSPIAVHAPITVHGSWNEKTSDVFIWILSFFFFFFFLENERKSDEEENERGSDRERSGGAEKR